ncbi:hypothetical protein AGR5A_Cc100040 [Agrobacterium genomosp. 5 str. CFBP 6626]|nr:hypothetical protein AGR5A_Cc100040 [Agrobacterium genomosp. 5 str. CFBP 6626]
MRHAPMAVAGHSACEIRALFGPINRVAI